MAIDSTASRPSRHLDSGGAEPAPLFAAPIHVLDRALLAVRLEEEVFGAEVSSEFQVVRGPNGGYLAALMLHALTLRVADPPRRPRLLSVFFPAVPAPGPAEIRTRIERAGRSVVWASAELQQQGRLCVAARAAFSSEWPSIEYQVGSPPPHAIPERGITLDRGLPPFTRHFEYHSQFAVPRGMAPSARQMSQFPAIGGHIRLRQPRPYDAPLLAVLTDAWFPATFAVDPRPVMAATLDLTVHFRSYAALEALTPRDYVLSVFQSKVASEGFFEESGELWSPDGRLLAQSRQLAIAAPVQR